MDNKKNDTYYINKIKTDLEFIITHMKNITQDDLTANEILLDSMMFRLIQISENAKNMSDIYRSSHPDIPWTAMCGLRNRIVHDYGNVDLSIVYTTLKEDIPDLLEIIKSK